MKYISNTNPQEDNVNTDTYIKYNKSNQEIQSNLSSYTLTPNFDSAKEFLRALYGDCDFLKDIDEYDFLFRTFDDNSKRHDSNLTREFYGSFYKYKDELALLNNKGAGIFVVVNQTRSNSGKDKDITAIRALFADFDDNELPTNLHLEPSIIVYTSQVNGIQKAHTYWLLEDKSEVEKFKSSQQALINYYGTDERVKNLSRIMRLPGFYHMKTEPQLVTITSCKPNLKYKNQNEIVSTLISNVQIEPELTTTATGTQPIALPEEFIKLMRKLLAAKEGNRNDTLNKVAFAAGGLVREGKISEDKVRTNLIDVATKIGLSKAEAENTFYSGFNKGMEKAKLPTKVIQGFGMKAIAEIVKKEAEAGNLLWDVYKEVPVYKKRPVPINELRVDLSTEYDIDISTNNLKDAIHRIVAGDKIYNYNAIVQYCKSLIQNHGNSLTGYIDQFCEKLGLLEPIERIYVRKYLIASVARAFNPGCHVDFVLIFYGKQGVGKTKTFEALYGKEYYATLSNETTERDILAVCRNNWCSEIGEWERYSSRRMQSEIKNFITKSTDKMRLLFTDYSKEIDRRFVLFGSTNKKEILQDWTGNRRYWICEVTKKVDRQWVAENRDLIWAEAVAAYLNGEQWILSEAEESAQEHHNDNFSEENLTESLIIQWINQRHVADGGIPWKDSFVTDGFSLITAIDSVLGNKINREAVKREMSASLRKLGFRDIRKGTGSKRQRLWVHDDINSLTGKVEIQPLPLLVESDD